MFVNTSQFNAKDDNNYQQICREIANCILAKEVNSNFMNLKEIDKLIKLKSSEHKLSTIPRYAEINRFIPITSPYKRLLRKKPIKTQSGIAVITVMPMPFDCPHGKCIYCPGGKEYNTPLSYIGTEPSTKLAQRVKYDSYEQVRFKVMQLIDSGHEVSKAEIVIVGGTFPFYPKDYQIHFVKRCYDALNSVKPIESQIRTPLEHFYNLDENNVSSKGNHSQIKGNLEPDLLLQTLNDSKIQNETAFVRCVGLTIETKPDYCKMDDINLMLELGTTRIELGVQSLNDNVFKMVNRGHTLQDVYRAFYEARNCGYKIGAHMMPGLPGSSFDQDLNDSKNLFEDERLKPDMLKIYPTLVLPNTGLYKLYREQKYIGYSTDELVRLLVEIKKSIPPWVRIMRIQREIESPDIIAGPKIGNIRQLVLEELKRQRIKCKCIRCREIGLYENKLEFSMDDVLLFRTEYDASKGKEIFLSFELKDRMLLLGFLRLRIMPDPLRNELRAKSNFNKGSSKTDNADLLDKQFTSAIVRELHVYGTVAKVGEQVGRKQLASKNKDSDITKRNCNGNNDNIQTIIGLTADDDRLAPCNQVKYQHKGLGRGLLTEAERICKEEYGLKKISVISAVGTRDYYRKFGYTNNGPYVTKLL